MPIDLVRSLSFIAALASSAGVVPVSAESVPVPEEPDYRHGTSYLAPLAYPPDYTHFDWVNPDAPKGGTLRLAGAGSYDSFNHFIHWGDPPASSSDITEQGQINLIYDTLLEEAPDERTAHYGRLAEGVAVAEDYSWVAFKLRENAYWHDGEPITVEDVIYSFETYKAHGSAVIRTSIKSVESVEQIGPREVVYRTSEGSLGNPNLPLFIGKLPVLPEHYWTDKDPSSTTTVPPLGSGPYRVSDYQLGRFVLFERVENYWGADLPFNRGRHNFDRVRYDYFRDGDVSREALTAGVLDVRPETEAKGWATAYEGLEPIEAGLLKRELLEITRPLGMWFPVFWNQRQPRFQDIRVREALWMLFDFPWINRVLLFDYYDHADSFFHDTAMAQRGLPSPAELELLDQVREHVPPRVFTHVFEPPDTSGYGVGRENVRRALNLLREAGWVVRDGVMVNEVTGEPFTIEFVVPSQALVRDLLPYVDALAGVGIRSSARRVESSNWQYRLRTRMFDASMAPIRPDNIPGLLLRNYFSSPAADMDFSRNYANVKDPAVDYLIDRVTEAGTEEEFLAATRALDRVLLWGFHFVPGMGQPGYRLVWWDRFGRPEHPALQRFVYFDAWWLDRERAKRVDRTLATRERD